jgi:hypothetical protein
MSASGHFRSIPRGRAMSVLPLEADINAGVYEHTPLAQLWKSIIADHGNTLCRVREQMKTDCVMTCRAKSIIYARRFVKSLRPEAS